MQRGEELLCSLIGLVQAWWRQNSEIATPYTYIHTAYMHIYMYVHTYFEWMQLVRFLKFYFLQI